MSELQVTEVLQPSPDLNNNSTPPSTTPSPDATESELKLSRKREREVSVEIMTVTSTASKDKVKRHAVLDEDDTPPRSPDDSLLSQSIQNVQDDATMISSNTNRLGVGSESGEKGLKRKFLERGTSIGPTENEESSNRSAEPLKRLRDESDKDGNPRETKRPSPPPSPPRVSPSKVHKPSGFMAYASTSSPFASVKGQNIFMSGKATPSPPPFSANPASTVALSDFNSTPNQSSTTTPTAAKRSGFQAFASKASSPFAAAARTKSPILGSPSILGRAKSPPRRTKPALMPNPFASYAGPVHSFSVSPSKRARAGSPDGSSRSSLERNSTVSVFGGSADGSDSGPEDDGDNRASSFGERLRAAKDYDDEVINGEPKVKLSEQDVMTGEEDEDTIYSVRGKLFSLDDNSWKEKGTGLLKLNVKREDGTGARLVMRKDAVYTVILNVTLFSGMRCSLAQDPRYLRVSAIENGAMTTYNIKVSNAAIARDLMEEINSNIPL